jgi:hypothetical protein
MQKLITANMSERVSLPPSLILARKIAWICPYSAHDNAIVLVGNLHKALAILPSFIVMDCLKCLLNAWCVARRFGRKKPCPCCLAFSPPSVCESVEHLSVCSELFQLRVSLPLLLRSRLTGSFLWVLGARTQQLTSSICRMFVQHLVLSVLLSPCPTFAVRICPIKKSFVSNSRQ